MFIPFKFNKMLSDIRNLYLTDEYILNHPNLHEQDSPWKLTKIKPLIDIFIKENKDSINILDVGGGAGLILNTTSKYIEENKIKVNKFALDLSKSMLKIQKKNNPDLKKTLNEDISKTSFKNKEIDLTLMIDVLEHIPDPEKALKELKRISKFIIFKIPLEDNLYFNSWNFIKKGIPRKEAIEKTGHINVYNFNNLRKQIEENVEEIIDYKFTNVFNYYLNSKDNKNNLKLKNKMINHSANLLFKISPKFCSKIFNDFVIFLVKS